MSEPNGRIIKITKEGDLIIRWKYGLVLLCVMAVLSSFSPRLTSFIFPDKSDKERKEIKTDVQTLREQLAAVTIRMEACEAVRDYLIEQHGLDKLSPVFPNTTKKVHH